MRYEYLKWLPTSEVLCHTTGRSNCAWDRELWQYWTFVNYKYLHLHFPQQGTCHAGFSGKTMNATIHHKRHLLTCVPGAELLSYTRGIPVMQYPAPWFDGSARREHTPEPGLSPALLLFWLALCSLKLFHSIRAPCHKPQRAQIVFGLVLCLSSTSMPWLAPGAATRRSSPCQPPRVVQIHLQGTLAWSGSTHIPWPQGSTLAAERGERGGRQDEGNWEKRSQDTNPTTHRSYTSHSSTPFGQTNLKTRSLTRLSLRTSLDHWQVSPIYSVIFILCKQGCVEFFFLFFFPKISADPYLTHPAYNYISILSFQKNLTDAHTWQYSGSSWPYWKQRAKETKIQQKSSWPQTRVHTEHKNKLSSAQ